MEIRIRETGAVVTESEFRAMHPSTSFPTQLSVDLIEAMGGDIVFEGPQAQPSRYQIAFRDGVEQIGGKWYTKYSVADMDADACASVDAQQAASMRQQRNQMLTATDWTQGKDIPDSVSTKWATYRQALRDVPQQADFPNAVVWPQQPE